MDTLHDLAHSSLDTSLLAQIRDILASLADNNACFLRGHDSAQGEHRLRIFLVGFGNAFQVSLLTQVDAVKGIIEGFIHDGGVLVGLGSSHC